MHLTLAHAFVVVGDLKEWIFTVAYFGVPLVSLVLVLMLMNRFVKAHERVAATLEKMAQKAPDEKVPKA